MTTIEDIKAFLLGVLFGDFRYRKLTLSDLRDGYKGMSLANLKEDCPGSSIDFDLAIEDMEAASLITTGPEVAYEDDGSDFIRIGVYSKYEYACLAEAGYKAALSIKGGNRKKVVQENAITAPTLHGIHQAITEKCGGLYDSGEYAAAVERSFRLVRERLRKLTGYETGSDAFGKGKLHINGAAESHVEEDFNRTVQFLTMAIDRFRNEKVHTVDGNIDDPARAYQYLCAD